MSRGSVRAKSSVRSARVRRTTTTQPTSARSVHHHARTVLHKVARHGTAHVRKKS